MLQNINPYSEETFKQLFPTYDVYSLVANDFDLITYTVTESSFNLFPMTPRQFRGMRITSAVPFWFIDQIKDNGTIYDIGCGWNMYKRYYNLHGIGGESLNDPFYFGDSHGWVDDFYVRNHQKAFDNIISMNSLHFIELHDIQKRVADVLSMTKHNGMVFLMFNITHMINNETSEISDPAAYIRSEMMPFKNNVISFELDDNNIHKNLSEGTFRLLLHNQ